MQGHIERTSSFQALDRWLTGLLHQSLLRTCLILRHAQCSEPADAAKIEAEIGEKVLHVDYAIHVLL